jgi:hypothetical protein
MKMAEYIMSILKTQLMVVWSWGFHQPMALQNGLRFKVSGFKFCGVVDIVYNEGHDLFDISFIKSNKVVKSVDGVYFDMLIDVLDDFIERTPDYDKRVAAEYSLV